MVRMSDILKKAKERKAEGEKKGISAETPKEQPQSQLPETLPPQRPQAKPEQPSAAIKKETGKEKPETEEKIEAQPKHEIRISQPVLGRSKLLNEEESMKLYKDIVSSVKDIYDKVDTSKEVVIEGKNVIIYVEKLVSQQCLNNDNILNFINLSADNDFIYNHVVNVCILSIEIGLGLEYDRTKLVELGTIAILHDVGMMKFQDLYKLPRKLSKLEFEKIKRHPEVSAEILEKFRGVYKKTISVIYQEHERVDGSGYPRGLKDDAIDEYAKIIGVADIYEALTHSRPYRDKNHVPESLKQIINEKSSFERKILKSLIERLCCPFPLSTYVELSSGEKGKVIRRNLGFYFRPIVEIARDSSGEVLKKGKIIDLIKHPTLYIKRSLEEE